MAEMILGKPDEPYAVMQFSAAENLETRLEPMGSKPKFWIKPPDDDRPWLFKEATAFTGEAWSEKVASEVAALLGIQAARVELAEFVEADGKTRRGCVVRSIIPHVYDEAADKYQPVGALVHGNEILSFVQTGYDRQRRRQQLHTLGLIFEALHEFFPVPGHEAVHEQFCGYLMLDAIIGNVDRHHENWGFLLENPVDPDNPNLQLADSFDHASCLGRELTDLRREQLLNSKDSNRNIRWYARRARGAIFEDDADAHGVSPLRIAELLLNVSRDGAAEWLRRILRVEADLLVNTVDRIPAEWASAMAKRFARELMAYSIAELGKLL